MERLVVVMQKSFEEYLDEKKMKNIISQDPKFYNRFIKEWNEITETLRQIYEDSKEKEKLKEERNKVIRPTSNSVIFK